MHEKGRADAKRRGGGEAHVALLLYSLRYSCSVNQFQLSVDQHLYHIRAAALFIYALFGERNTENTSNETDTTIFNLVV